MVDLPLSHLLFIYRLSSITAWNQKQQNPFSISSCITTIGKTSMSYSIDSFRHPMLSEKEHFEGCQLGIDTWAATSCAGNMHSLKNSLKGNPFQPQDLMPL